MTKKILFGVGILWTIFICVMSLVVPARAADPELLIEFQGVDNATEYQLFIELTPGELTQLATLPQEDPPVSEWSGQFFGIPMGKTLNYYLGFTDTEGEAGINSPAYPFKLRGQGVIINIRRIK